VHGGRGEALIERGEMEEDKGKKEEPLDLIMMDDDQIKQIMATIGKMRSRVPYQYKVNTKKRVVTMREGLVSDEEEVEDLGLWRILRKYCVQHMRGRREVQEREEKVEILSI
jgi:hypothetical protein